MLPRSSVHALVSTASLLGYHLLREQGWAGFALLVADMGLLGCVYFGSGLLSGLRDPDLPSEHTRVALALFGLSVLVAGLGAYSLAELTSPLVAARLFLATGVLVAGILAAFFVAWRFAAGESEALGCGAALVVLAITAAAALLISPH